MNCITYIALYSIGFFFAGRNPRKVVNHHISLCNGAFNKFTCTYQYLFPSVFNNPSVTPFFFFALSFKTTLCDCVASDNDIGMIGGQLISGDNV